MIGFRNIGVGRSTNGLDVNALRRDKRIDDVDVATILAGCNNILWH